MTSLMSCVQHGDGTPFSVSLNIQVPSLNPWEPVPEEESLRLAPIASDAVPPIRLQSGSQPGTANLSDDLFDISKQVIRLEEETSTAKSLSQQDVRNVSLRANSPVLANEKPPPPQRQLQKPNARQRPPNVSKGNAPPTFTFVNMKTADGKRDWEAETQIRSHAARRVHASKSHAKKVEASILPPLESAPQLELGGNHGTKASQQTKPEREPEGITLARRRLVSSYEHDNSTLNNVTGFRSDGKVLGHLRCRECDGMQVFHESHDGQVGVRFLSSMANPFGIGQSQFDPFGQTATPITHRMHELLSHWVFDLTPKLFPMIYGKNNISKLTVEHELKDAMEDDVACHLISAAAGLQQSEWMLRNASQPLDSTLVRSSRLRREEARRHVQWGVRKLNSRFKDHKQTLSAVTITNVGRLAVASAFVGDAKAHRTHHLGFVRLVELRGGINTLSRHKAHHTSRIDSNGAWTDRDAPRLPMYEYNRSGWDPRAAPMGSPFPSRQLEHFLWEPLFTIAVDLQHISKLVDERLYSGSENPLPQEKTEWCEDTFAATQHKLVSFPHPEHQPVKSVMYFRQNCWRCAAFIYFNTALRITPGSGLIKLAVERLTESLQQSEPWTGWAPHSHVLLWVLFMGIVGAWSETEKALFRLEIRRLLFQLQLSSVEDVRQVLTMQVWRDAPLVKHFTEIPL